MKGKVEHSIGIFMLHSCFFLLYLCFQIRQFSTKASSHSFETRRRAHSRNNGICVNRKLKRWRKNVLIKFSRHHPCRSRERVRFCVEIFSRLLQQKKRKKRVKLHFEMQSLLSWDLPKLSLQASTVSEF